jgi:hypothetical protein
MSKKSRIHKVTEMLEDLYDFKEVVTYVPAEKDSGERIEQIFNRQQHMRGFSLTESAMFEYSKGHYANSASIAVIPLGQIEPLSCCSHGCHLLS